MLRHTHTKPSMTTTQEQFRAYDGSQLQHALTDKDTICSR